MKRTYKIYVYQLDKEFLKTRQRRFGEKGLATLTKITFGRYQDKPIWELSQENSTIWLTLKQEQWSNKEGHIKRVLEMEESITLASADQAH